MRAMRRMFLFVLLAGAFFALTGVAAASSKGVLYLQKKTVSVAVIPADNRTQEPAAALLLDKVWEEALVRWGALVANADHVVGFAVQNQMNVDELREMPLDRLSELGEALGVDYILYNTITEWTTVGSSITRHALVSCVSVMYEARTGAVVWEDSWSFAGPANVSETELGNSVFALAHSSLSTMTDGEALAAVNGVDYVMNFSMPIPGFEPGSEYSASKWTSRALQAGAEAQPAPETGAVGEGDSGEPPAGE